MSLYTAFDETFTGTAGNVITGTRGAPVQSAPATWSTFSPYPSLVYAAGGGAVAAIFSSGVALSVYPLAGVSQDQTVTIPVRFATIGGANAIFQLRRSLDGANDIGFTLDVGT